MCLSAAQGLAFMASRKGGLGVTIASAHGFVIRKLASDSAGNQKWSAPVFFKESQVRAHAAAAHAWQAGACARVHSPSPTPTPARPHSATTDSIISGGEHAKACVCEGGGGRVCSVARCTTAPCTLHPAGGRGPVSRI